jgi:uncharacterized protein YjbJ (UPF0337 family)
MNTETMQGQWQQMKGKLKERWGKLTDDDVTIINGQRDQLIGKLQERYGKTRDAIEKEVDEFSRGCNCDW